MSKAVLEDKKRLVILAISLFCLFSLVILKFFQIQIIEGEKWTRKANQQHRMVVEEPFRRGRFFSNTSIKPGQGEYKQPLVLDVLHFHLYLDPYLVPEHLKGLISSTVCSMIRAKDEKKNWICNQFHKKSRSRKLSMWLTKKQRDEVYAWWAPFARKYKIERNALFFIQDYKRSYPFGSLLGQVLHTVRELKDEQSGQGIPTGGLELIFDRFLQGKKGRRELLRSPRNPMDMGRVISKPQNGADIYLTINHNLQAMCEEEIAKAVKKARAKSGWVVMMEPRTGEVLALAQYPFFNPGKYRDYFNDPTQLEHTKVKAVTDVFEPGSTIKPLTLAVCFKANEVLARRNAEPLFSPFEKVDTHPCFLPGRNKPLKDLRVHPYLNMYLALQKSSNVYMGKMILRVKERLGSPWYRSVLSEILGFGRKTGIELPSESAGLLPTPGKTHPNGTLEWSLPTPYSLAMGHNLLTNSLQMVRAYAVLANGGFDVKPTIVRKIVRTHSDGTEHTLLDNTQMTASHRLLDPNDVQKLIIAMKAVTKPGGTSPKGDIFGYTEVGKSSTSEKIVNGKYSKKVHFSSFVGFAPVENPRFVLFIGIDEPEWRYIPGIGKVHQGGQCAAPVFREIGHRALNYLGVAPDDPHGYPTHDPRFDPEKADWIKEVKALKSLYQNWNQ